MMMRRVLLAVALLGGCDDGSDGEPAADMTMAADAAADGMATPDQAMVEADAGVEDGGEPADMAVDMADPQPDAGLMVPAVYTTTCAPCHGPQGEGTALGYELQHPVEAYSSWVVRNGRPAGGELPGVMTSYDTDAVSDADLEAIWAWLQAMPRAEDGEGLYRDFCGNCHGPDGRGGAVFEGARGTAASITRHVRGGEGGAGYGVRQRYMPAFDAARLSDAELQLIIDFLGG